MKPSPLTTDSTYIDDGSNTSGVLITDDLSLNNGRSRHSTTPHFSAALSGVHRSLHGQQQLPNPHHSGYDPRMGMFTTSPGAPHTLPGMGGVPDDQSTGGWSQPGLYTPTTPWPSGHPAGPGGPFHPPPTRENGWPMQPIPAFKVKPDASMVQEIKDIRFFRTWVNHFETVMTAQGMEAVLVASFVPRFDEEYSNDKRMTAFAYYALSVKVKYPEGKRIVYEHRRDRNGRAVLFRLKQHYQHSSYAIVACEITLQQLHNLKLNGRWTGTYMGFIYKFQETVDRYNEQQMDPLARLVDNYVSTLLQAAVSYVPELHQVRASLLQDAYLNRKPHPTYQDYIQLLGNTAMFMDEAKQRHTRSVQGNMHEVQESEPIDLDQVQPSDEPLLVNEAKRTITAKDTRLGDITWDKIGTDGRELWSKLKPDQRHAIMNDHKSSRSANVAEVPSSHDDDLSHEDVQGTEDSSSTPSLQVNASDAKPSSASSAHPGDVRRTLSSSTPKPRQVQHVEQVRQVNVSERVHRETPVRRALYGASQSPQLWLERNTSGPEGGYPDISNILPYTFSPAQHSTHTSYMSNLLSNQGNHNGYGSVPEGMHQASSAFAIQVDSDDDSYEDMPIEYEGPTSFMADRGGLYEYDDMPPLEPPGYPSSSESEEENEPEDDEEPEDHGGQDFR